MVIICNMEYRISREQKRQCMQSITKVVATVLNIDPASVSIAVNEFSAENCAVGGHLENMRQRVFSEWSASRCICSKRWKEGGSEQQDGTLLGLHETRVMHCALYLANLHTIGGYDG